MKKTMIIALLAVLVLGVFIACDGDVNADLVGGRTITLEIPSDWCWSFDVSGAKTKVVEIPSDCDTWAKLLEKETSITITDGEVIYTLIDVQISLSEKRIYFCDSNKKIQFGLLIDNTKVTYPDTTLASEAIKIGGTYVLTSGGPT